MLGSVEAGLLLGQLIYWHGLGKDKVWMYKTIPEMESETGLSRTKQQSAIQRCVRLGVLEVKRKSIPAKRHFRVDMGRLEILLPSLPKYGKLESQNHANYPNGIHSTITDSTQKITQNNTPKDLEAFKKQLAAKKTFDYMREYRS